eukprot:472462_1
MWDDTLDNLAWNDKIPHNWGKVYSSYVRLTSMSNNNVLEFHSILECTQYLSSELNQQIKYHKVRKWCHEKNTMHGYQFMFVDQSKYNKKIESLVGEKWKLFFETETCRSKHYISSFGRIKRVRNSGSERLIGYSIVSGYKMINYAYPHTKLVHRIVAKHWVENPNNYNSVDHIDGDPLNNLASNLRY